MNTTTHQGAPQFPTVLGSIPSSTREEMDAAIEALQAHKDEWVAFSIHDRIILIDIESDGHPKIPGRVTTKSNGQVAAQVFPQTIYDRLFFERIRAEIWMEPGVKIEALSQTQAVAYHEKDRPGKVALVLGAGNVASIGPMDVFYKLFVENQIVLFKANPVNAYLGPLMDEAFRVLVDHGFLRVVYGGAAEGSYLCNHPGIEEIHITGSDKTFDAIVFGSGSEGIKGKAEGSPC